MREDPRLKGREGEEEFFRYIDFGDFGHPLGAPFIPGHVLDGIRDKISAGFQDPVVEVCGAILVRGIAERPLTVEAPESTTKSLPKYYSMTPELPRNHCCIATEWMPPPWRI